jgi:hypothetical protein
MSPRPPEPEPDRPPRIAVVVVPGVGDDGLGDTASTLSHSLVRQGYFDWAVHDEVTVTSQHSSEPPGGTTRTGKDAFVPPPPDRYAAPRRRLGRGTAARPPGARSQPSRETDLEVDVYEMNWADLSRFPSGLLRFVFALFGLVLQLGRAGIESGRYLDRPDSPDAALRFESEWRLSRMLTKGEMPGSSSAWARAASEALSWWLAIVVVPVTALVVLLCAGVWLVTFAPSGFVQVAALIVGGLVTAVLLVLIGRGMEDSGLQRRAPLWILAISTVSVLIGALFGGAFTASSAPVLAANTLLGVAAFPLRLVWLAALALSVAGILISWILLRDGRSRAPAEHRPPRWRAGSVTLLSVTVSPFALAMVSGIVLASSSLVLAEAMSGQTWRPHATELRCLSGPADWTPERCLSEEQARAYDDSLAFASRQEELAGTPDALPGEEVRREMRIDQAEDAADSIARQANAAPVDWVKGVFVQILEPVALAALVLVALLVYLLVRQIVLRVMSLTSAISRERLLAIAGAPSYVLSLVLASAGLRKDAASRREEGVALTGLLRRLTSTSAALIVTAVSLAAVAGTYAIWILGGSVTDLPYFDTLLPSAGFDSGAAVSIGAASLLVLARFLPLDPRRLSESVGGGLERARAGLDILYDVMTYVREGGTAARFAVVARYRALLAQVAQLEHEDGAVGYDGIIFAAHSQGTVYTAATLFGDDRRRPTIYPLASSGEPRAYDGLRATPKVSFLSFGSPIRQTYDRFFPEQYGSWYSGGSTANGETFLPLNDTWLNLYRPGDYVGRAVNRDAFAPESNEPDAHAAVAAVPQRDGEGEPTGTELQLIEACINLPGAHTKYWGSDHVAAHLNFLIERAAGHDPRLPRLPLPSRSEIADESGRGER